MVDCRGWRVIGDFDRDDEMNSARDAAGMARAKVAIMSAFPACMMQRGATPVYQINALESGTGFAKVPDTPCRA
jgi:hypothetical protein